MYTYSELSATVLRSIKEILGLPANPLLTDCLVSKLDADELDMIEIVMTVEDYLDADWDISYERVSELDLTVVDLINDLAGELKVPVSEVDSQPTYTQSELSCIESLEDEVAKLEELCSDYSEHVKDVEYKLEQHNKALNKWVKLTHLVSQNTKVADLLGARIGDDVIDKIYDYLLSVATKEK